jgi:hypothetical protein
VWRVTGERGKREEGGGRREKGGGRREKGGGRREEGGDKEEGGDPSERGNSMCRPPTKLLTLEKVVQGAGAPT